MKRLTGRLFLEKAGEAHFATLAPFTGKEYKAAQCRTPQAQEAFRHPRNRQAYSARKGQNKNDPPPQSKPTYREQKQSLTGDLVTHEAWRAHRLGDGQSRSTRGSPPHAPAGGNVHYGAAIVGNRWEVPQKVRHRHSLRSNNLTSGYLPKGIEGGDSNRYFHANVHGSFLYSNPTVKMTHQEKDGWAIRGIHTLWNSIQPLKRNGILTRATTGMTLEDTKWNKTDTKGRTFWLLRGST